MCYMKSPKEYAIVDIIMKQQHTHESMLASHCFNLQWWNVFRKKKRLSQNKISILVTVTKNIADESLLHINEEPSIM